MPADPVPEKDRDGETDEFATIDPVQWVERDTREWVLLAEQPDLVMARMLVTYLETSGIDARVGSVGGRYCVEVPDDQYTDAIAVHEPAEDFAPPMQEERSSKTGVHTGRRIRAGLGDTAGPDTGPGSGRIWLRWLLRVAAIAVAAILLLVLFASD